MTADPRVEEIKRALNDYYKYLYDTERDALDDVRYLLEKLSEIEGSRAVLLNDYQAAINARDAVTQERDFLVRERITVERMDEDIKSTIENLESQVAALREALEKISRIPLNLKELGENWTERMATHGAEARDIAKAALHPPRIRRRQVTNEELIDKILGDKPCDCEPESNFTCVWCKITERLDEALDAKDAKYARLLRMAKEFLEPEGHVGRHSLKGLSCRYCELEYLLKELEGGA